MVKFPLSRFGCLILATTVSLPCDAISIEQAWHQTKQNDPGYKKAKISVQASDVGVDAMRSPLLPSLSAKASVGWNESATTPPNYGASLNQTIWDSSAWSGLDKAKANYIKAKLSLTLYYNNLAGKLLLCYLDVASAQSEIQLAKSKLEKSSKLLMIIEKRYLAGKVKSVDVEEISANHVEAKAGLLNARADLEVKRVKLAALTNLLPKNVDQIRTEPLVQPPMRLESKQQWVKLAKDSNPKLLVAIQNVKTSELEKKEATGGYYPKITSSVAYDSNTDEFSAGVTLDVPIDINGAISAKVDTASLNVLIARQNLREVEIDIQQRVTQQFIQVDINWDRVLIANELVTSHEKVLSSKEKLYEAGLTEVSEVINAYNQLFESKHKLQTHLYNYWRQRIGLLKIAGKLDDDSMALISKFFSS
ncbi:TolC family protein [Vibrio sp. ZSDE26]|uniref:TolC family protein n=1 Tax=Vibrio amylolyticus TaxID=2847292 RepID=A0A9X1XK62_9VIBR|nr:TolC family protein [Vibrio amylolyticus]MCK6263936.1 TolC family protein [Vibrio amylolyticus]